MCVCTPEIKSPHCGRCAPSNAEVVASRKKSALEILGPLGFVDAEDDDAPGAIWHRHTLIAIDVMKVKAGDFVGAILEVGKTRGREAAQKDMRKACGLE